MKVNLKIDTIIDIDDNSTWEDYRDEAWSIFAENLELYYLSDEVSYDVVPEDDTDEILSEIDEIKAQIEEIKKAIDKMPKILYH